ncbi:hypothetical protein [Chryseobacterium sp. Leaf405]|uniref:hypothetical protein n=1 Tax=Chryseobacterium sp. Leaf405 TaxID=1736367 RepID=UPI000A9E1B07|nr:hypothetical protein [Chryseobacterium sp. Leaf405]
MKNRVGLSTRNNQSGDGILLSWDVLLHYDQYPVKQNLNSESQERDMNSFADAKHTGIDRPVKNEHLSHLCNSFSQHVLRSNALYVPDILRYR